MLHSPRARLECWSRHDLTMNKIVHHHRQPVTLTLSPAIFDQDVLAIHIASLLQRLAERGGLGPVFVRRRDVEESD